MHLKNFTLIRVGGQVSLSPSYDLVNSTIVLSTREEIALPVRGKKSKLKRSDLIDYLGIKRLGITQALTEDILQCFEKAFSDWFILIQNSFLSSPLKSAYQALILERWRRLI